MNDSAEEDVKLIAADRYNKSQKQLEGLFVSRSG
jgi:hypothetical protein